MQKIFPFLPKFQIKYKGIFGHLLQALNYYVYYGAQMFMESRDALGLLFDMANISLFNKTPPIFLSNNMEGALLYQFLLQNLEGPLVQSAIGDILTNVLARLRDPPMSPTFRRVLMGVYFSVGAHPQHTDILLNFFANSPDQQLAHFLSEVSNNMHRDFRNSLERKIYSLCLTNIIFRTNHQEL